MVAISWNVKIDGLVMEGKVDGKTWNKDGSCNPKEMEGGAHVSELRDLYLLFLNKIYFI